MAVLLINEISIMPLGVRQVAPKFSVFVVDPQLFIEIVSTLRKYGARFRVPKWLDDACLSDEILVVDAEGLSYLERRGRLNECREVLRVFTPSDARKALLRAVLGGANIISIGVDLGKRAAYAVLAGGRLLTHGYVDSLGRLNEMVRELSVAGSPVILLGVGAERVEDLTDELAEVLSNEALAAAYVIEEKNTNWEEVPKLIDVNAEKLPSDVRAAISIAVRVYEKYLTARW